jgi:DNA-binding response OmpR family regulator
VYLFAQSEGIGMAAKRSVLLIEDAAAFRKILCDLLQADGFQVRSCSDGASALNTAEIDDFHVIITDYRIPNMNGADVTKKLRARFPESIIIGISLEDMRKEFLAAGADAFLQKPFEYDDLVKLINENMSYQRA